MKQITNPLLEMLTSEQIKQAERMFGKKAANQLITKPVYKYDHKGLGEGLGDQRK